MSGFTKLFNSILASTIWSEPDHVRILWITMLAMCDKWGEVQASVPGLAHAAHITVEQAESGLECFLSPDRYSRTPDFEGRRIEVVAGGWRLLNHGRYRKILSAEERREYNRIKQAEHRAKAKQGEESRQKNVSNSQKQSMTVNDNKQSKHIAEAEAEAEADSFLGEPKKTPPTPQGGSVRKRTEKFSPPSLSDVEEYGKTLTPPFAEALKFHSYYESNGWRVGRNPMKSWRAAVATWNAKDPHHGNNGKPDHRAQKAADEYPQPPVKVRML